MKTLLDQAEARLEKELGCHLQERAEHPATWATQVGDGHNYNPAESQGLFDITCKQEKAKFTIWAVLGMDEIYMQSRWQALQTFIKADKLHTAKPLMYGSNDTGSYMIFERLSYQELPQSHSAEFGTQLAKLHLEKGYPCFGFEKTHWVHGQKLEAGQLNNWLDYFRIHCLENQLQLCLKQHQDYELVDLLQPLLNHLEPFFEDIQVTPSLTHGFLHNFHLKWAENTPLLLDPLAFYGHHEIDLCLISREKAHPELFNAYHKLIPQEKGYEKRASLYRFYLDLFNYNSLGAGFRLRCLNELKTLLKANKLAH